MRVKALDQVVLNVRDAERALEFYSGTTRPRRGASCAVAGGDAPFPSVRVSESTIIDLFDRPRGESNVDHICLVVDPLDWQQVIDSGPLTVLEGPVNRFGARGEGQSVYVQDPDGNTVELRWYTQDLDQ